MDDAHAARARELWGRFMAFREDDTRSLLIEHYRYLLSITAHRIRVPAHIDYEDLIGAGALGLIKAIDTFDPGRNTEFKTYAIALIRGAMLESLRSQDWIPRKQREEAKVLEAATAKIGTVSPTPEQLADEMGVDVDRAARMIADAGRMTLLHLDTPAVMSEDFSFSDLIPDPSVDVASDIERAEQARTLRQATGRLPEREQRVLHMYYTEGKTFRQIAAVFSLSESRIYQLHMQATRRLRRILSGQAELFDAAA